MKKYIFFALSIFNFLFYFSMRCIWSGIEGMLQVSWLAYFLFGLFALLGIINSFFIIFKVKKLFMLVLGILSSLLTLVLFYMFYLGIGSYKYIIRSFQESVFYFALIAFVFFLIFKFQKIHLNKNMPFKAALFLLISTIVIVKIYDIKINFLTNEPVVYAVEENYQIVWTTSADSTARVTIGGKTYYDVYAGSERSETKVHKVIVPMQDLDKASSYTITSTTMIYRGPYSGLRGRTITKTYDFKAVDLTDGLKYYSISDTHEYAKAAKKTANYFGEELDFLVIAGDISSHLEKYDDIEVINEIAHSVTKGARAVVYARGNHEVKSLVSNNLHKYVGSLNEKFYYTFKLSGVFGIVLDLGEDHADSWWEFYDTARFNDYRMEQFEFLRKVVDEKKYLDDDIKYRLAVCHMPINYVDDVFVESIKLGMTTYLNEMNLDMMVSGHIHELMPITTDIPYGIKLYYHEDYSSSIKPQGYRIDSNFNTFVVSRRSNVQDIKIKENLFGKAITGLATAVDFSQNKITVKYTNTNHNVVDIVNPFTGTSFKEYDYPIKP